ncbi:alpha/beta hydrolase family protein [Actinokineospora sp. UTMC 2448]|uniref:alpha/beta hydrolase n=1 Tax=Actinokineospora sp. UTMC 2448 TaxID=2268449 RepID=UPI00216470E9|nr:esterase family protein [Actinokineospora sp. UTMC 2448]UVS78765.1 Endo-1,4-beta-xylanase Z precursor [Actinokineospora sp. UTMC 2448]
MRRVASVLGCFALTAGLAAPAQADTAPPTLADGFGITVISQPEWADDNHRTFTFTVRTAEVPEYTVLPGQVSGEHVVMVTLPEGYDGVTRYPVHYTLHGGGDYPNSSRAKDVVERATEDVPLITVTPNGGGRGWYTNWVSPGALGRQNWETFHLDQLVPFIDANLATVPTRAGRALSGHSMGGFGAFHYAEHRPDLFSHVGSFSGGLDLLSQEMRAAVVGTTQLASYGTPTVPVDAIFGPPIWPLDGVWNAQSPAQHVAPLRGMGIALYSGNGGDLTVDPIQAAVENRAHQTAVVTSDYLTAAGIPHQFIDYGDGAGWAPGCTGKHNQTPCLQADMDHFVRFIMTGLQQS